MDNVYSNTTYVLADQTAIDLLRNQLGAVRSKVIFAKSIHEVDSYLIGSQPDLIIVHGSFLSGNAEKFEKISKHYIGIKFIPLIYIGTIDDPGFSALVHFRLIDCYDGTDYEEVVERAKQHLSPSVRLRFWGVRGSTPCANYENIEYGGNTSCVEIEYPGMKELMIMDSGTGIRNLGNYLERKNQTGYEGHIFITHPHWDHIQGFPFFKPFYSADNSFSIHMPEQYRGGAQEILSGHLTKTFFPVTLNMLAAKLDYVTQSEELQSFSHYKIEYLVANHPTKTAIYKIHIGGLVIVYAPDNEIPLKTSPIRFLDNFTEFIRDCDLLIHDGQFSMKQYEERIGWGHSAWERVVEVAKRAGVKNLFLTHHDPDSNDDYLEGLDANLSKYIGSPFEMACLAKEGMEVRMPVTLNELVEK
ncbi:hypothetical protein DDZ15_13365 [Rhodohalobacter mucosus]|uniref:Metallo-beta-lactamase domain-containing protein n=1 Tax=Rhodohalobacter mucosus TaxID=2079485 RepID=A0A316TRD0_9BACT|nr:hypothetical protein DDZ15_13365 [Rhodohalobacter mucosus]